jgi:hypothetical protein
MVEVMGMKKWNLPLTYAPKIPKVISGECTQTIRAGRKIQVGDLIAFHGWEGRPYRSGWTYLMTYREVTHAIPCRIYQNGMVRECHSHIEERWLWSTWDPVAEKDGIEPPTGKELGRVLNAYHNIPADGLKAQIIRWKWEA